MPSASEKVRVPGSIRELYELRLTSINRRGVPYEHRAVYRGRERDIRRGEILGQFVMLLGLGMAGHREVKVKFRKLASEEIAQLGIENRS